MPSLRPGNPIFFTLASLHQGTGMIICRAVEAPDRLRRGCFCRCRSAHMTEWGTEPMADEPQYPPTIDLDVVRLRPLRMDDADALYADLRDPVVTELTSYPVVSMAMVERMIERSLNRWAAGELSRLGIALQHNDQLVGTCGFNDYCEVHRWAEMAFELAQSHWGKGLMSQAVAAVLQWTYRQDRVNRVHAFVRVDNSRSVRLLERSGFFT